MQNILPTRRTSRNLFLARKAKRDLCQAVVFSCDQTCCLATALQYLSLARDEQGLQPASMAKWAQHEIKLPAYRRGCHLVTDQACLASAHQRIYPCVTSSHALCFGCCRFKSKSPALCLVTKSDWPTYSVWLPAPNGFC